MSLAAEASLLFGFDPPWVSNGTKTDNLTTNTLRAAQDFAVKNI
jgi:hypothetical protein